MASTWEEFCKTFQDRWLKFTPPNRKTSDYVKFIGESHSLESNIRVIKVNHNFTVGKSKRKLGEVKNRYYAEDDLSYYKLFKNCEFVEDKEILDKLNKIQLKLDLRTTK